MPFSMSYVRGGRGALAATDLCRRSTAHDRFQDWGEAGVFLQLWQAGVDKVDELKGIDWEWLSMDGAMPKAPFGGEKTGPTPPERAKSGVKRRVKAPGSCKVVRQQTRHCGEMRSQTLVVYSLRVRPT